MNKKDNILEKIEQHLFAIKYKFLDAKEAEEIDYKNLLAMLFLIIFFGLAGYSNINESPDDYLKKIGISIYSILWYVANLLLLITTVSYFQKVYFFKELFSLKITKFLITFYFGYLLLICNAEASSIINSVFAIDANNFTYSLNLLTLFILAKKFCIPLVFACLLNLTVSFFELKKDTNNFKINNINNYLNLNTTIITFSIIYIFLLTFYYPKILNASNMPVKAYYLAQKFDFYSKNTCNNIDDKIYSVIFIGKSQNKVLIAPKERTNLSFPQFLNLSEKPNFNFRRESCL